jgi:hypothetical protein
MSDQCLYFFTKISLAIIHVNIKLKSNVSKVFSFSIIKVDVVNGKRRRCVHHSVSATLHLLGHYATGRHSAPPG